MKKLILLFLVLVLKFGPAKAQWVTIPDTNFVAKLTQLFPNCMNGNQMDTTCAGIVNATSLNVRHSNITDLSGIEYFDNLGTLNCNKNLLTAFSAFPLNLTVLNCDTNQLTSLLSLPLNLHQLYCSWNQISSIPFLPNSLTILNCNNNILNSLPTLPNSLTILNCNFNQLSSISSLPNSLSTLNCINNQLSSLPILPNNLLYLFCSNNQLSSLPNLPNSMIRLDCSNNQIITLSALSNSLTNLVCYSNQLSSLPSLPSSLTSLACEFNQLSSLPLLPNSIVNLNCSYNQLSNLPPLPNSLGSFNCDNNQLISIPALPNTLNTFSCKYNQLSSIPALPTSLAALDCSHNQLTNLQAVPNVMAMFNIRNNNISCLVNLPYIIPLGGADISFNPFSCVPNQTSYSLNLPLCLDNDSLNNPSNCPSAGITGFVYTDLNNSCSYNNIDLGTNNIPVKLINSSNFLTAISYTFNGAYAFNNLPTDTYTVKIEDNLLPIIIGCGQGNTQLVNYNAANSSITNINFPVNCEAGYDIKVQSVHSQGIVFPGQIHTLKTHISENETWYNLSCDTLNFSGTVVITVSGPVSYLSPDIGAITPQVSGNTFTYTISDFNNLNPNLFNLKFVTDTIAQANDQICVHVQILPTPLDTDSTNNVYDFCYNIVNSYDPNMKEVYPVNVLPGYDDWFTYTIHFQNTGNAPAFNIRLRDTLDSQLDLNTFEVLGYSHPANVGVSGNILTVRFNNIMLPDSTSDYEGSMGYFQYRAKPLPNMPNGSQISNTAYIYFDYNAPIITNATQNNFLCTPTNYSQSFTFCLGDSVQLGNNWYSSAVNFSNSLVSVFGCDSIVNTTINPTIIDTALVATGNTISASSVYSNYEWINCSNDSTLQNSASNHFIIPFSGEFKVRLTNSNGCIAMSSCFPLNQTCLPINTQQSFNICIGDSVKVGTNWYSNAGNYSDTFITTLGCDSIVNTIVSETSIDTSVVLNGDTLFAVSGFSSYSWIDCSTGLLIDGENSNFLVTTYDGFFKSVITTTNGCESETSCIPVILTSIGNKLNTIAQTFEIYPNPSTGIFTFKDVRSIQKVEVYNILGEEILSQSNQREINLNGFSKGIYFAKINGQHVVKLVKE